MPTLAPDPLERARAFHLDGALAAKLGRVRAWFRDNRCDAAIVGVSGGVDSAVVLGLLAIVAGEPDSPLRRVVGVLAPIGGRGATGQLEATARGAAVCRAFGVEAWTCDLTEAVRACVIAAEAGADLPFDAWAEGQLASVARTPLFYGAAALLQAHGFKSVVVGTTNRDEGAYLGFFGKASDGMVDLQPISDLHKAEVAALAARIGVPAAVIAARPSGDVHDGRDDEAMIGAPYPAIARYLQAKALGRVPDVDPAHAAAIEALHAVNAHKYRVGSPAVHLDVYPRVVPGGWEEPDRRGETRPAEGSLPGEWVPGPIALDPIVGWPSSADVIAGASVHDDVLTAADCDRLAAEMAASGRACPVGVTGYRGFSAGEIGSVRATAWAPELARMLWERVRAVVPGVRFTDERVATDWFATPTRAGYRAWRAIGVGPVLRFMRYEAGGEHYGHYDAGFDYGDGRRSLVSAVFYLSDAEGGGETRFLDDGQGDLPVSGRTFADWTRPARPDEVIAAVVPRRGRALLFDHRMCHDVAPYRGSSPRIIVRGDVVYDAIPGSER